MKPFISLSLKFLLASVFLNFISFFVGSRFLNDYLGSTVLSLLIAIYAISISSITTLSTKLSDLHLSLGINFDKSLSSLGDAFRQQLTIILFFVIILILKTSFLQMIIPNFLLSCNILLLFSIFNSFQVTYDVTNALITYTINVNQLSKHP
jgi:hypothetical protein